MWKLSWPAAFAEGLSAPADSAAPARGARLWSAQRMARRRPQLPRALATLCLLAVSLLAAGCADSAPLTGSLPGRELLQPATPTWTPEPMATPTPEPTATPTPTPTPLPAQAVAALPNGQIFFSVSRGDEAGRSLWRFAGDVVTPVAEELAAGGWDCTRDEAATCVVVARDGQVTAMQPDGAALTLLDLITAPPSTAISATLAITLTAPLTTTDELATAEIAPTTPLDLIAAAVQIAPDGRQVAVAAADSVRLYDLQDAELRATAWITGAETLRWSPNAAVLAVIALDKGWQELLLWQVAQNALQPLARVERIGATAWSPSGAQLAFDAHHGPGFNDVFVYSLTSGELRNLTELGLRAPQQAAAGLLAAWRPAWEADTDEASLTYVRGNPSEPAGQTVVRQALKSWQYSALWPLSDEGLLGLAPSSDGQFEARLVARDGAQLVQLRPAAGDAWLDLAMAPQADVQALLWDPPAADGSHRYLLIVRAQGLSLIDTWTGQPQDLATTCPQCRVEQVLWRP